MTAAAAETSDPGAASLLPAVAGFECNGLLPLPPGPCRLAARPAPAPAANLDAPRPLPYEARADMREAAGRDAGAVASSPSSPDVRRRLEPRTGVGDATARSLLVRTDDTCATDAATRMGFAPPSAVRASSTADGSASECSGDSSASAAPKRPAMAPSPPPDPPAFFFFMTSAAAAARRRRRMRSRETTTAMTRMPPAAPPAMAATPPPPEADAAAPPAAGSPPTLPLDEAVAVALSAAPTE